MKEVTVGCGSGFWGDAFEPAEKLVESGVADFVGFDFLAELTMSLLQRAKSKNPSAGYVPDTVSCMSRLAKAAQATETTLISNGGGVNPGGAADALKTELEAQGIAGGKIGVVTGDDVLPQLDTLIADGADLTNIETGDTNLSGIRDWVTSAHVYLGSEGIADALDGGAQFVITGRVADSALIAAPIMSRLGWSGSCVDQRALSLAVAHILECAAGCTGGMSSRFDEMPDMGNVGFPICTVTDAAEAIVTKLPGTGGRVDRFTIIEHILYEIDNPARYRTPDGIVDFTTLELIEEEQDHVRIKNVTGQAAPETLKAIITYADGWIGEGILMFPWPNALARAQKAKKTLEERFEAMQLDASAVQFDFIGVNMLHGPAAPFEDKDLNEVGLRIAVKTKTKDEAEKVRRACSQLWIMGPGGSCFGVPIKPRPSVRLWPTLLPRDVASVNVEVIQ